METANPIIRRTTVFFLIFVAGFCHAAQTFTIATYNVDTYLDQPTQTRPHIKTAEAKAEVCDVICAMNPDVIALEEMGTTNALLELRASLKDRGLDYPNWDYLEGWDTNIHVAILSKFPIVARHPHTDDEFLLDAKRFRVSRGIADLEIQPAPGFTFTLIAVHLKSKLPDSGADPNEQRLDEAKILRQIINDHFKADPEARMVVLGDFNDEKDSDSVREIIGRGKLKLMDTRPAERNGDNATSRPAYNEPRNVTWTYFYGKNDTYSRIDYILISPAMRQHWLEKETYIPVIPNWGIASDHRPIVAGFQAN